MNSTLNKVLWLVSLTAGFSAVVLFTYFEDLGLLYRVLILVGLMGLSLGVLAQTEFGKNAMKLISDARVEVAKVVWPSRGETTQMTIIVLVMILILALIFWGLDSLLSINQMPKGIPVATVAIGESGAINSALLAASILSNKYEEIQKILVKFRQKQTREVLQNNSPQKK